MPRVPIQRVVNGYTCLGFCAFFAQRFGKAVLRAVISSCTQLLERIGRRAMTSLPAAITMPRIARFSGVMDLARTLQASEDGN